MHLIEWNVDYRNIEMKYAVAQFWEMNKIIMSYFMENGFSIKKIEILYYFDYKFVINNSIYFITFQFSNSIAHYNGSQSESVRYLKIHFNKHIKNSEMYKIIWVEIDLILNK